MKHLPHDVIVNCLLPSDLKPISQVAEQVFEQVFSVGVFQPRLTGEQLSYAVSPYGPVLRKSSKNLTISCTSVRLSWSSLLLPPVTLCPTNTHNGFSMIVRAQRFAVLGIDETLLIKGEQVAQHHPIVEGVGLVPQIDDEVVLAIAVVVKVRIGVVEEDRLGVFLQQGAAFVRRGAVDDLSEGGAVFKGEALPRRVSPATGATPRRWRLGALRPRRAGCSGRRRPLPRSTRPRACVRSVW
jgi:hypothetical protein